MPIDPDAARVRTTERHRFCHPPYDIPVFLDIAIVANPASYTAHGMTLSNLTLSGVDRFQARSAVRSAVSPHEAVDFTGSRLGVRASSRLLRATPTLQLPTKRYKPLLNDINFSLLSLLPSLARFAQFEVSEPAFIGAIQKS
jgi:hypothetical protein